MQNTRPSLPAALSGCALIVAAVVVLWWKSSAPEQEGEATRSAAGQEVPRRSARSDRPAAGSRRNKNEEPPLSPAARALLAELTETIEQGQSGRILAEQCQEAGVRASDFLELASVIMARDSELGTWNLEVVLGQAAQIDGQAAAGWYDRNVSSEFLPQHEWVGRTTLFLTVAIDWLRFEPREAIGWAAEHEHLSVGAAAEWNLDQILVYWPESDFAGQIEWIEEQTRAGSGLVTRVGPAIRYWAREDPAAAVNWMESFAENEISSWWVRQRGYEDLAKGWGEDRLAEVANWLSSRPPGDMELDSARRMADFPTPNHEKKLANLLMRMMNPGLAESWQETLERVMARGKGGSSLDAMSFWSREDPDAALAWYREKVDSGEIFGEGIDTPFERKVFRSLVRAIAESDPNRALELFQARAPELRTEGMTGDLTEKLVSAMIKAGDDSHMRRMFELHDRSELAQATLAAYAKAAKFGEGVAFIEQFVTDPGQRADVIFQAVVGLPNRDSFNPALDWVRDNTPAPEAPALFRDLGERGAMRGAWLEDQQPGPIRDHGYLGRMEARMESGKYREAFADAENIGDQTLCASAQERVGRAWLLHDQAEATEALPVEVLQQIQDQ